MKKIQRLLLIVVVMVGLGMPVSAQESTDAPVIAEVTPAAESTAAAPDMSVVVEDGGVVNIDAPESSTVSLLIDLVKLSIVVILGGGSFALMWDKIRRSKQAKDALEMVAEGLPPAWKGTFDRMLEYGEAANKRTAEALQFLREVTDGRPNTEGIPVTPGPPLTPEQMLFALIGTPEYETHMQQHTKLVLQELNTKTPPLIASRFDPTTETVQSSEG